MAGDAIELRGLQFSAIVGVLPQERTEPQPLELDVDLHVDLGKAGASDDLADTVDYGAVCDAAEAAVTGTAHWLLEALAEHVAGALLAVDDRIASVTVVVRKLRPPVPQQLATSGVRMTRERA